MSPGPIEITFLDDFDSLAKIGKELNELESLLNACAKHLASRDEKAAKFKVSKIEKNSPLKLALDIGGNIDLGSKVAELLVGTVESINGRIDNGVPSWILEKFKFGKAFAVTFGSRSIKTSSNYTEKIDELLGGEVREFSDITGTIQAVDIHDKNIFKLFPRIGSPVRCDFEKSQFEQVREAIGRRARVSGLVYTRPRDDFPHRMTVEEITVLPDVSPEKFDFTSLRGVAKNGYAGLSSVEHVRSIRSQMESGFGAG